MLNKIANYTAFYVSEPFSQSNLGAYATPDFIYYQQLCSWKGQDSSFPFTDAHKSTYNVRDNSSWETLKIRLHERLRGSKNIILFSSGRLYTVCLNSQTLPSQAGLVKSAKIA